MILFLFLALLVLLSAFAIPFLVSWISGYPELMKYGEACQYVFFAFVAVAFLVYFSLLAKLVGFSWGASVSYYFLLIVGFTMACIKVYKRC